ncbi:hypothetical protein C8A03DRAFT_47713 [Achaetomium macrosporum]|uniref:Uncharacterized protein n=1 Tax=Achaetomium macrosporum TaxID=79813 RepID=A0AAN7C1W7_9PEZI|nr:hypothetical protein C8A03DRAFT_47713 [Achaetomium macrosporum]
MRQHHICISILQLLASASAQEYQFFRWNVPGANLAADNVDRRQSPPPGYHPEFGSCGSGRTCEDACGPNWISCQASTSLSLFCYNQADLNQTCCENGSGRACDNGYYCAWQEFGGRVWCCENGQSLEECGVPPLSSSTTTTNLPTSSGNPGSPTSTSGPPKSGSPSGSTTEPGTLSATNSQCPASTVTSWATTTVTSTYSFAAITVTVTIPGPGCEYSSATSSPHGGPSGSTSVSGTITDPASPSSTSYRPPTSNTTSTQTVVTAGSRTLNANPLIIGLVLIPLLWL